MKRTAAWILIAVGLALNVGAAWWIVDIIQTARALVGPGQRAAVPSLIPMLSMVPVGMLLLTIGVVMLTKRRVP